MNPHSFLRSSSSHFRAWSVLRIIERLSSTLFASVRCLNHYHYHRRHHRHHYHYHHHHHNQRQQQHNYHHCHQHHHHEHDLISTTPLIIEQVVLRYFHLTTFFWMFLEGWFLQSFNSNINNIISINSNYLSNLGLYLFLQVQLPLSLATVKHLHFLVIGWGGCPVQPTLSNINTR